MVTGLGWPLLFQHCHHSVVYNVSEAESEWKVCLRDRKGRKKVEGSVLSASAAAAALVKSIANVGTRHWLIGPR